MAGKHTEAAYITVDRKQSGVIIGRGQGKI
jgi:hypothetical protein